MASSNLYGHLKRGSVRVSVGQVVKKGDEIGILGNTGISTGPHLHFTRIQGERDTHWSGDSTVSRGGSRDDIYKFLNASPLIKNRKGLRPYEVTCDWYGYAGHGAVDLIGPDRTSVDGESVIVWNQDYPGRVIGVHDYGDRLTGVTVIILSGFAEGFSGGGGGSAVKYGSYPVGSYEVTDTAGLNVRTAPRRAGKSGDVVRVMAAGTRYTAVEELRSGVDGVWHKLDDGNYCCAQLGAEIHVKSAQEWIEYRVKSGDTLSAIGARYGLDAWQIARDNGIDDPDVIFPGQKILIKVQ